MLVACHMLVFAHCAGKSVSAVCVCLVGLSARGMLMLPKASGLEENLFTIAEFADAGVKR